MAKYLDENGLSYFWQKLKSMLVPSGGSSGQVLAKASGTDYDLEWVNQSGGSYTLPPATTSTLGGVIVGEGLGVNSSGKVYLELSMSLGTSANNYIPVATSAQSAASATGWHVRTLKTSSLGTVKEAFGIIHGTSQQISTSWMGGYRGSTRYYPLPEAAKGIIYLQLAHGSALGGSAVAGMGAVPGGNAASWQYAAGNSLKCLQLMFTSPTSQSSAANIYVPVKVVYIV